MLLAMLIRGLLIVTALAPIIGINLAYWIGAVHDNLPSCIPYFDGCTSISSTGRYPPGDRLFRAVMLPQAVLLAVTWYFTALWLQVTRPLATKARVTALTDSTRTRVRDIGMRDGATTYSRSMSTDRAWNN